MVLLSRQQKRQPGNPFNCDEDLFCEMHAWPFKGQRKKLHRHTGGDRLRAILEKKIMEKSILQVEQRGKKRRRGLSYSGNWREREERSQQTDVNALHGKGGGRERAPAVCRVCTPYGLAGRREGGLNI